MTKQKDQIAQDFGNYLAKLLSEAFNSSSWYAVSYDRNKSEILNFLDKLTVMTSAGYTDDWYSKYEIKLKLDLYKLQEYNPGYKDIIPTLKSRYYIFNVKHFMADTLGDLVAHDLDVTAYLIQELIKINS